MMQFALLVVMAYASIGAFTFILMLFLCGGERHGGLWRPFLNSLWMWPLVPLVFLVQFVRERGAEDGSPQN